MKHSLLYVLILVTLTFAAPSAFAAIDEQPPEQSVGGSPLINIAPDPCDGASSADECMASGGPFIQCAVRGGAGGTCIAYTTHTVITVNGPRTVSGCEKVSYNASCSCDPGTHRVTGNCIYMR